MGSKFINLEAGAIKGLNPNNQMVENTLPQRQYSICLDHDSTRQIKHIKIR
jgi:hypothetical protein